VTGKRARVRLCFQILRCLSGIAVAGFNHASLAVASCSAGAGAFQELALPPLNIAVPRDAPVGASLGSVHVAAVSDIPFACRGTSNEREVKFAGHPLAVPDFGGVYRTNVAGIGMRVTASGGSFAGIDDGPRLAPYKVMLPEKVERLAGFGVQIDFIKIGPTQDGVLAAGKLLSVLAGGADLVDVDIPADAIVFTSLQCDAVRTSAMAAAGIGTGGAFSEESVMVSTGCHARVGVMIQLNSSYVYRSGPLLPPGSGAGGTAAVAGGRIARPARHLADGDDVGMAGGGDPFGAAGIGSSGLGASGFSSGALGGAGRGADFRR
jgi:hypothetical protein